MSNGKLYSIPSGKFLLMSFIAFFTFSATSIALAPGSMYMASMAAFFPLIPLSVLYEEASSDTLATSRILTIVPSGLALITMFSNSSTVDSRPEAVTGIVTSTSSTGCFPISPAADSRFWSFNAFCMSFNVSPMFAIRSGYIHICMP